MPISESMVQDIVQEVMAKMQIADAPTGKHGVFKEMNDAIEAAKKAELIVKKMSMDQREKIITCIRKKIKENAEVMARMGVDETADIRKAAQDIVNGCTFDNNLPCIAEKEVVAVSSVVDELMHYMLTENDCYLASKEEQDKLTEVVLAGGKLNRKCVGRDARTLLSMIGVNAPANIRCIIFEGPKEHPLITTELMMPILGIVRARDFDDAVEQAVWLEHGNRHSAHIHSKNIDNITKYAKAIDTAILVKNGPSYSALGFGGEGFCTFTIASRTGEGLTSASTFTKRRRCVMSDSLCIR